MMIYQSCYKNRPAVTVESDTLRAVFLPMDGAKLASLTTESGKELMETKEGENYRVLTADGSYIDSECSAFDDMFPTIDPYTPTQGEYQGITYPDHGEACRIPYTTEIKGESAVFSTKSSLFNLRYEKTVTAEKNGILIRYRYENLGEEAFPFVWAGHIILKGEDGARLFTPFDASSPIMMMFGAKEEDALPKDRLCGFVSGKGPAYKFYYIDPISEGLFGIEYPDKSKLSFTYDEKKLPFLGVWLNNGTFKNSYSIAPEPCNIPFDAPDKAAAKGHFAVIPPHGCFAFDLLISYQDKY